MHRTRSTQRDVLRCPWRAWLFAGIGIVQAGCGVTRTEAAAQSTAQSGSQSVVAGVESAQAATRSVQGTLHELDASVLAKCVPPVVHNLSELPEAAQQHEFGCPVLLYDPSGRAMHAFHRSLAATAKGLGQTRILFYGASHVAADFMSGHIREVLQRQFGDAGHGFIVPVRPWRHYRHLGMDVANSRHWDTARVTANETESDYYGLAGVYAETDSRRAYGRVDTEDNKASRFELFYLRQPEGGVLQVKIDGVPRSEVSTTANSPTAGFQVFHSDDTPHIFEVEAKGKGDVRVFGVAIEREVPGVIVDTLGINGARARYQLLWRDAVFLPQLRRRLPDLVVLAYGTNEAGDDDQPIEEYAEQVNAVLRRMRRAAKSASCLLLGPSDRPVHERGSDTFAPRPRTAQVVRVQREAAKRFGCAFFDLVAVGGGAGSMPFWAHHEDPYAQRDYIHFTRDGYVRVADVLLAAMMRGYSGPRRDATSSDPG